MPLQFDQLACRQRAYFVLAQLLRPVTPPCRAHIAIDMFRRAVNNLGDEPAFSHVVFIFADTAGCLYQPQCTGLLSAAVWKYVRNFNVAFDPPGIRFTYLASQSRTHTDIDHATLWQPSPVAEFLIILANIGKSFFFGTVTFVDLGTVTRDECCLMLTKESA